MSSRFYRFVADGRFKYFSFPCHVRASKKEAVYSTKYVLSGKTRNHDVKADITQHQKQYTFVSLSSQLYNIQCAQSLLSKINNQNIVHCI